MAHPLKTPGLVVLVAVLAIIYSVGKSPHLDAPVLSIPTVEQKNLGGMASAPPQTQTPIGPLSPTSVSLPSQYVMKQTAQSLVVGDQVVSIYDVASKRQYSQLITVKKSSTMQEKQAILDAVKSQFLAQVATQNSYIIEYKTTAPATSNPLGISYVRSQQTSLSTTQQQFASDFNTIKTTGASLLAPGSTPLSPRIETTYNAAFAGAFVRDVTPSQVQKIQALTYVKRVVPNMPVSAALSQSVPYVKAPQVWPQTSSGASCASSPSTCLTGQGVTIGIIDTGVDYTHPDLGGCLGPTCKVIGGVDIVNNDNDPMDDHGHGTHVAATAAGKDPAGVYNGVAPGAKIMAIKVLDDYGGGTWADVIEGIDRALDPNQDGNYADKVQIISMSIGGLGSPTDPVATAVDTAVASGVTVVVAAGNSGMQGKTTYGYSPFTINSPGGAKKAITVGSASVYPPINFVSYYSSVGPAMDAGNPLLKPDIIAPGFKICAAQWSTFGEGYYECNPESPRRIAISGTSMATPHVAGAAALLLQQRPSLTPEQVKSALMTSAAPADSPDNAWWNGAGILDALTATKTRTFTSPQSFNFGIIDTTSTASISRSVVITNTNSYPITYNVKVSYPFYSYQGDTTGSLNYPSTITVPGNGAAVLTISLSSYLNAKGGLYSTTVKLTPVGISENSLSLPIVLVVPQLDIEAPKTVNGPFTFSVKSDVEPASVTVTIAKPDGTSTIVPMTAFSKGLYEDAGFFASFNQFSAAGIYTITASATYAGSTAKKTVQVQYDIAPPVLQRGLDSQGNTVITSNEDISPTSAQYTTLLSSYNYFNSYSGYQVGFTAPYFGGAKVISYGSKDYVALIAMPGYSGWFYPSLREVRLYQIDQKTGAVNLLNSQIVPFASDIDIKVDSSGSFIHTILDISRDDYDFSTNKWSSTSEMLYGRYDITTGAWNKLSSLPAIVGDVGFQYMIPQQFIENGNVHVLYSNLVFDATSWTATLDYNYVKITGGVMGTPRKLASPCVAIGAGSWPIVLSAGGTSVAVFCPSSLYSATDPVPNTNYFLFDYVTGVKGQTKTISGQFHPSQIVNGRAYGLHTLFRETDPANAVDLDLASGSLTTLNMVRNYGYEPDSFPMIPELGLGGASVLGYTAPFWDEKITLLRMDSGATTNQETLLSQVMFDPNYGHMLSAATTTSDGRTAYVDVPYQKFGYTGLIVSDVLLGRYTYASAVYNGVNLPVVYIGNNQYKVTGPNAQQATIYATDQAGNTAKQLPDTTPPVATITSPLNNQSFPYVTTTVNLTVSTNEAATCRWSATDVAYSSMTSIFTTTGSTVHKTLLSGLKSGMSYKYFVRCVDLSNNSMNASAVVSFSVAPDTVPPSITITQPLANANVYYGDVVPIVASVTDPSGVSAVRFTVAGKSFVDTTAPYQITWNTANNALTGFAVTPPSGVTPTNVKITVTANDTKGNTQSVMTSVNLYPGLA